MENILTMSRSQRVLFATGLLFLASGLFHVGVWLNAGMPALEGPVTWRKPITFGLSTGVLFMSLSWVLGLLPQTERLVRQAWLFSALLVAEIALIDMQQWRGVASHFNDSTPFDAAVFTTMGVLIMAASVQIALWTRALFRHALPTTRAYAVAAKAGMVMLNVGNLVGLFMAATEATSFKPVHGIALHAIQALPVAVWVVARLGYPRAWRDGSRLSRWLSSPEWRHQ
jgi:hypothetical protein